MEVLFIRHGEPDYSEVTARHYIGHGRDLAKLTEKGMRQAKEVSKKPCLKDAEIIVSSPYTRALQTAAVLSAETGLPLAVENDLHEWMPDLTFTYSGPENFPVIEEEMRKYKGEWNPDCQYHWESISQVGERALHVLKKYLEHKKIIVVAHGMVIQRFCKIEEVESCSILTADIKKDSGYFDYY